MGGSKLLRGTVILTIGNVFSRLLGLLYNIPFFYLVGKMGNTLYMYGYVPYTLFISVATAGIPLGVAKFIAKYNELGEYRISQRLFRSGLLVMLTSGVLSFLLMYSLAPQYVEHYLSADLTAQQSADAVQVIRAVSFALIIVPVMSLIRGYFQGFESMGPSAVSQVVEQLVRIIFILASSYVIIRVLDGEVVDAVAWATFAAFVSALAGLGVLIYYWLKRRHHINELIASSKDEIEFSYRSMYKELMLYAAPFVAVGSATALYQFADQGTFLRAMADLGKAQLGQELNGVLGRNIQQLVVIPVLFATSMSMAIVPSLTKAYFSEERKAVHRYIQQSFQIVLFITVPAVLGMSVLAGPIYRAFYNADETAYHMLAIYAPASIFFALFSLTAGILQGINRQWFTVISLAVGVAFKWATNYTFTTYMEVDGAILATTLGYFISVSMNIWKIKRETNVSYRLVIRRGLLMSIIALAMMLAVKLISLPLLVAMPLDEEGGIGNVMATVTTLICVALGGAVYGFGAFKTHLLEKLFGERFKFLQRKRKKREEVKESAH